MSATLSPLERERLAKLLALLGSDFAGERDAAGQAAHRLVTSTGLTWQQTIIPAPAQYRDEERQHQQDDPILNDWRTTAVRCTQYPQLINRWETKFLTGLPRFPRLSTKQKHTLGKIVIRLRACGCAV